MTLTTYTLREMSRRPGRALLTLSGIVIGVSAIVAISMTIERTRGAYREMFETLTGRAALEVVGSGMGGFDSEIADHLAEIPGIEAAVPVVQTPAGLVTDSGTVLVVVLGVHPELDKYARDYEVLEGAMPGEAEGALLAKHFAREHGLNLGEPVRLLGPTGIRELPVVGLLAPRGAASINGGAIVFMPMATAQRLAGLGDRVNSVQLVLSSNAVPVDVRERVAAMLPTGLSVQAPAARAALADETLFSTELGLTTMSVVSLVAASFVILNSFLMSIGERRRQFAILRALGASRRQVKRLLLAEGLSLGIAGTLIGIPLGLGLAVGLSLAMETMLGIELPPMRLSVVPLALGGLLGPAVAIAACWIPARQAAGQPPLEGLFDRRPTKTARSRRGSILVGVVLIGFGLFVVSAIFGEWLPLSVIVSLLPVSMAVFVVGGMLLLPLAIPPTLRAVGVAIRALFGVEGGLAIREVGRRQGRTNLTVGVLAVSVMVSFGFGNNLLNSVRNIQEWIHNISVCDYFVRGTMPDMGTMAATTAPESLAEELSAIEGVEWVGLMAFVPARAANMPVILQAHTVDPRRALPIELDQGDPAQAAERMLDGEVIIGTIIALRTGLGVGDTITLQTPHGPKALKIAGTSTEYTVGGWTVRMEWRHAQRLLDIRGAHMFMVTGSGGATPELTERLRAFAGQNGLSVESMADFQAMVDESMSGVVGSLWMLMALMFIVASFGVLNTLTINVIEQTREIGVLRAVAMTRRQIRRMVLSQALAMGALSLVPGLIGGITLAGMMQITGPKLNGYPIEFHLEWSLLIGCIVVAIAVAAAASLLPARRAARMRIIGALQYE